MKKIVLAIVIFSLCSAAVAQNTTRRRLRVATPTTELKADDRTTHAANEAIVVHWDSTKLVFRGYDKPLRSSHESFFATNADSVSAVEGFNITITYLTPDGRMLHRRSMPIVEHIPAGETRRIKIPTWDSQRSFYYINSERPRRTSATPYRITLTADSVCYMLPTNPTM